MRLRAEGVAVHGLDWKEEPAAGARWLAENGDPYIRVGSDPTGRTAQFLRILGALAIGGSGVLYMLQGLYHTNTDLRNWVYLALMAALGAGGIFSQRLMQDSKGARLFFALAALLIPVQFSQLGGMTLSYFSGAQTTLPWFAVRAPEFNTLLLIGTLSIAAALSLSFAGFSILARSAALRLTTAFVVMNLLLLLPFRDSIAAVPVILALIVITALLEIRTFRRQVIFQTFEGTGVRLLILLPMAIAICRSAFHFSDAMGISAILGISGFIFHYLAECETTFIRSRHTREVLCLFAFALLILVLPTLCHELFNQLRKSYDLDKQWLSVVYGLPALACTLYFSARSYLLSLFYQLAASTVLCITIAWVLDSRYYAAELVLWCATAAMLVHGFIRQQKITFVCGALAAVCLGAHLIYAAVRDIHLNLWLALAIGGLGLMVLSSICEKHGRKWVNNSREYWRQFSEWETR